MVHAFKVLLATLRTHIFKRRRKKEKKEKESLFYRLDVKVCQGFLKKYYPT
jgi:hypothetical protein